MDRDCDGALVIYCHQDSILDVEIRSMRHRLFRLSRIDSKRFVSLTNPLSPTTRPQLERLPSCNSTSHASQRHWTTANKVRALQDISSQEEAAGDGVGSGIPLLADLGLRAGDRGEDPSTSKNGCVCTVSALKAQ